MKKLFTFFVLLISFFATAQDHAAPPPPPAIIGRWDLTVDQGDKIVPSWHFGWTFCCRGWKCKADS
jgi:hypothetical protein